MAVSAIPGYGQIQNIYAYHNTHYNQMPSRPVTAVSKISGVVPYSEDEDQTRFAASRKAVEEQVSGVETAAVAKQTEKLQAAYTEGQELRYDLSNPYEAERMVVEGLLVTGMNIDVVA